MSREFGLPVFGAHLFVVHDVVDELSSAPPSRNPARLEALDDVYRVAAGHPVFTLRVLSIGPELIVMARRNPFVFV